MHPSFQNLPGRLSRYLLSKFLAQSAHGRERFQVVLAGQIDEFLINLSLNRIIFNHCSKRNYWFFGWFSESPFIISFRHCFIVFLDVQVRLASRRICVCWNVVHMRQLLNISVSLLLGFGFVISRTVSCLTSVSRCWVSWCFGAVCRKQNFYHHIPYIESR